MSLNEQQRRDLIKKYCTDNPNCSKNQVFRYFKDLKFKKAFIYNTVRNIENKKQLTRKVGSGKKCPLQNSQTSAKLKAEIVDHTAKSYRELGRRYKVDGKTVKKYVESMGVVKRTKKTVPAVTDKQEKTIKQRLHLLTQNLFSTNSSNVCVMDDETYFTIEGHDWTPKYYFKLPNSNPSPKVTQITKTKFPAKVLLWMAVSERGISDPVFFKSGLAVNANVYIHKCLPVLKRFIDCNHKNDKTVFWPDLASAHYAKATQDELKKLKIDYVPKEENPPNVPQLRPIETFWANLKRKVYGDGYRPKNIDCLILKIKRELRKIDTSGLMEAMRAVPQNIRKADRCGADFFL